MSKFIEIDCSKLDKTEFTAEQRNMIYQVLANLVMRDCAKTIEKMEAKG